VLWRLRTTLSDRPGALAALAARCGEQGVNILALQIFPGLDGVTDELVLRAPDKWRMPRVAELVEGAGGRRVTLSPCTEHALVDGPTRYLQAARLLLARPDDLGEILAGLLDAEVTSAGALDLSSVQDVIELDVAGQPVAVRRTAPFTPTERARAAAFAELGADLPTAPAPTQRPGAPSPTRSAVVRVGTLADARALVRMHDRCSTETIYRRYDAPLPRLTDRLAARLLSDSGGALVAVVGTEVVGVATLADSADRPAGANTVDLTVLVEDAWQRRGIGSRLLATAARMARGRGASEVVLRTRTGNPSLLPAVFASGLRGRIRMSGETVVVTAGVEGLKPLEAAQPVTEPTFA
jgi:GNAT superfamily N-acetyltransferase